MHTHPGSQVSAPLGPPDDACARRARRARGHAPESPAAPPAPPLPRTDAAEPPRQKGQACSPRSRPPRCARPTGRWCSSVPPSARAGNGCGHRSSRSSGSAPASWSGISRATGTAPRRSGASPSPTWPTRSPRSPPRSTPPTPCTQGCPSVGRRDWNSVCDTRGRSRRSPSSAPARRSVPRRPGTNGRPSSASTARPPSSPAPNNAGSPRGSSPPSPRRPGACSRRSPAWTPSPTRAVVRLSPTTT